MLAVVTGASGGIGRELAYRLAARDMDLLLVSRGQAALAELADELRTHGQGSVRTVAADLAVSDSIDRILEALDGDVPDLLINNAGRGDFGQFQDLGYERQEQTLLLNIHGLTFLTHALLPDMLDRGTGMIVNVASTAAFVPTPWMATYGATKAYVRSFSEALAHELRASPLRVLTLCPGATRTGFATAAEATTSNNFKDSNTASVAHVADYAIKLIVNNKDGVRIHGLRNRLQCAFLQLVPQRLALLLADRVLRPQRPSLLSLSMNLLMPNRQGARS